MSAIRCVDWRDAPAERVAPLYAAERHRWMSQLEWDAGANFEQVELGRRLGHVRGVLALDRTGAIAGWSFYLEDVGTLQVGGFVAASEACSEAMLSAIFDRDAVQSAASTFFAYSDAPGLAASLRRRGHSVDRYFYMACALRATVAYPRDARRWSAGDLLAGAELMKRAYREPDSSRPFAAAGELRDWLEYLTLTTTGTGCGALVDDACLSLPFGPGRLSGLALVTRIAPSTAHLVQLVVDPDIHRRGVGSALLSASCTRAYRSGYRRLTMMVSGRNVAARRLYEAAGFEAVTSFVASGKAAQPLRLTSVAGSGVAASLR
jgi:ribosomal protein S18 acetylase RimI-like enzyme